MKDALVGKYFHSVKNDLVCWQGQVTKKVGDGLYMVLTYEWIVGSPYLETIIKAEDMVGWFFYDSAKEMQDSYEIGPARYKRSDIKNK